MGLPSDNSVVQSVCGGSGGKIDDQSLVVFPIGGAVCVVNGTGAVATPLAVSTMLSQLF
jgi:hypothetical protein